MDQEKKSTQLNSLWIADFSPCSKQQDKSQGIIEDVMQPKYMAMSKAKSRRSNTFIIVSTGPFSYPALFEVRLLQFTNTTYKTYFNPI